MEIKFRNILIPVDLSISTEVAIEKGMSLCADNAVIHLLHIIDDNAAGSNEGGADNGSIEQQLDQLKSSVQQSKPGVTVMVSVRQEESVQKAIEKHALQSKADLVIIGKNSNHSWFPFLNTIVPSEISQRTGIVVLTVKPGAIRQKIRSIVVPVSGESAFNKLEVIAAVCGQVKKIKIHLLTFLNENGKVSEPGTAPLLEVYQWLQSMHYPVEYAILPGNNKAKEILRYAEKIDADVLLLDPGIETKIGWPNKHISDVLPVSSKLQVLSV